jgi:N-methylhydantoinase B
LEIFWHRLIAICDEMAMTLQQAAFSGIVREARDFACAVFDSKGNMLAQASYSTLALMGSTFASVKNVCGQYPPEQMVPGDILVTNDPWLTTGQLNDLTMVTPIFRGRLAGFAVCVVHHLDIGGRAQSADAIEVYEEGLWLPVLRLYKGGEPNEDVYSIIRQNVRSSDKVVGDIKAQLAATATCTARVRELLDEADLETLDGPGQDILHRTEQATRQVIARIPDGTYAHTTSIDDFDEPVRIHVAITVKGSDMHVDYSGTSPQIPRGVNSVLNMTRSATLIGVRCAANPDVPHNHGAIVPIHVTAPEASILNPTHPSPLQGRHVIGQHLAFAVFGALSQAIPDKVMAASGSPVWVLAFDGLDRSGRPFLVVNMLNGGMGARATKDGWATVSFPGNVTSSPSELLESEMPILIERRALIPDSAGAGTYRGGCGQEVRVRVREDASSPIRVAMQAGRFKNPAFGLMGGLPGTTSSVTVNDGSPLAVREPLILMPGDVMTWRMAGGGGYGDPLERDPEAVRRDGRKGFVTPTSAREVYGVIVSSDGAVDERATQVLRQTLGRSGGLGRVGQPGE